MGVTFNPLAILFLVVLVAEASHVDVSSGNTEYSDDVTCIESEKQALLRFKWDLVDPANRLLSWVGEDSDCYKWAGMSATT